MKRVAQVVFRVLLLIAPILPVPTHARNNERCESWTQWQQFKSLYVSNDGRVIDASTAAQITTSEGQSYALLFALAANDRSAFDGLLRWTENNLAQGDLAQHLPAWQWGHAPDGSWRVMDNNAASDADVWIAYALAEAGRLWREPGYTNLSDALSGHILRDEAVLVPKLGFALLPGPRGFVADAKWRFNASYSPLSVLRYLGARNKLWNEVADTSLRIIQASAPHHFAADWIEYRSDVGFITDRTTKGIGSYDAIRVYLWAGMLDSHDTAFTTLTQWLRPAVQQFIKASRPPETIDSQTLEQHGSGSPGFAAALLPLLNATQQHNVAATLHADVLQHALRDNQAYFSDALTVFGIGASDGWLHFDARGQLIPKWRSSCAAS